MRHRITGIDKSDAWKWAEEYLIGKLIPKGSFFYPEHAEGGCGVSMNRAIAINTKEKGRRYVRVFYHVYLEEVKK